MHARTSAHLWLAGAMVTVGSTVVASKVIGEGLPPFTATALRFALALPVFAALMRLTGTPWPRPGRRDALLLGLQASCGSVGYTVFLISGTRLTAASEAGVIIGALPAMAALVALLLLRERPRARTLGAIGLATAGVLVSTSAGGGPGGGPAGASSLAGDALVLAAVACEGVFILLNKRLHAPLPPLALATAMAALGLIGALPFALAETIHQPPQWNLPALLGVAYYALVPTVAGFWLWYAGAARVSGSEASLFTAIAPASGVLLSVLLLGEPMSARMLAGLALVVGAVLLQARPLRRRQPAA